MPFIPNIYVLTRTSSHAHPQSLSKSDVATISKWSDDQSFLAAQVLILENSLQNMYS